MFLGDDLLAWLVLALGAAMAVGNLAALVGPRRTGRDARSRARRGGQADRRGSGVRGSSDGTDLERAPLARSVVYIVVGTGAAIWALATLVSP